jgi:hypothetical protein
MRGLQKCGAGMFGPWGLQGLIQALGLVGEPLRVCHWTLRRCSGALMLHRWTLRRRSAALRLHRRIRSGGEWDQPCRAGLRSNSVICSRRCPPRAPVRSAKFERLSGWLRGEPMLARSYRALRARSRHEFREACRPLARDSSFLAMSMVGTGKSWSFWHPVPMDPGCCAVRLGLGC